MTFAGAKYTFDYPITQTKKIPPVCVGKLHVTAHVEFKRSGEPFKPQILQITYFQENNTRIANDIKSLLEVVAPELYNEICEAAQSHATDTVLKTT